ncbi:hypothetical protein [Solwaraspora sp. WMMA2101]|uniref:hypothetical protein n=1 Tax=Solwaraspora sp. WMMA2101 TaxID=3404124 RepID=UPI003B9551AA
MRPPVHRTTRRRATALVAVSALVVAGFVAPASPGYADDADLIVNGGFETGLDGWFVNNGNATDSATRWNRGSDLDIATPLINSGVATTH